MAGGERLLEIVMPQLGITVTEGTLVGWHKQPGDRVEPDEAICDVSSDKVDSEVPAPAAGRITELIVAVGETVEVGTVIAMMEADQESAQGAPSPVAVAPAGEREPAIPPARDAAGRGAAERHSPVVVRLAAELGVALERVVGSGRDGRVRREDVLAAAAQPAAPASSELSVYTPPPPGVLSRMRRSIGEHMKRSLSTAATVTSWIEVDFSAVEARRRELGVTALPVVAAATVETLAQFGELNAWLEGERYTRHTDVNLGIAVSLGAEGLIVPVVRAPRRSAWRSSRSGSPTWRPAPAPARCRPTRSATAPSRSPTPASSAPSWRRR